MSHFTCDRTNCPKWKEKSSSKSSSIDDFDKVDLVNRETQMSNSTIKESSSSDKTYVAPKSAEKPTEANFNRNNKNIKCQQKIICSSTTSQTCPTDPNQMSALMMNCMPSNANNPCNPVSNTTINSSPREKCTCKIAEVPFSSSSTSIVSEHFPVKRKMPQKEMPKSKYVPPSNRTIVITCMAPRPARLQPTMNVPGREQYFSCSSEDTDADETMAANRSQCHCLDTKMNKTQAILQLLQEIISLLNTNVTKREEPLQSPPAAFSGLQEKYSEIPPVAPESEMTLPPPPPPPPEPEPEITAQTSAPIPHWCPCFCFAQGMAMATGQPPCMPCMQPFNLQATASYEERVQKPILFELTEDSFKDCFSSSVASAMAKDADFVCGVGEVSPPCVSAIKDELCDEMVIDDDGKSDYKPEKLGAETHDEEIAPVIEIRGSFDHHKCYGPGIDSLEQYEDEEPTPEQGDKIKPAIGEETPIAYSTGINADGEPIQDVERGPQTDQTDEPEQPNKTAEPELTAPEATEPETDRTTGPEQTAPEATEPETDKTAEPDQTAPETTDYEKEQEAARRSNVEFEQSTTARIDGDMSEVDQSNEKQLIRYVESEEEESYYPYGESEIFDDDSELAKEKFAESCKEKETPEEEGNENRLQEMKFFIDSLIMDLEAMDYARRRTECEKKLCKPKPSICCRESFPVTITEVEDLSSTSLYVKWIIHDCCGIGGYEIYTDGYLTNRFYHAKHEAAVITNVDITMPHKISLVAQPSTQEDSIEMICDIGNNKTVTKSLPWKTNMDVERKALYTLWTPSVYLYSPPTC
ncbi:hypothetical protein DOY81_001834 [Sarcophaga bullata]|nr:hypothetical protein DOY81_001834 [Sarcophaga bullata]